MSCLLDSSAEGLHEPPHDYESRAVLHGVAWDNSTASLLVALH